MHSEKMDVRESRDGNDDCNNASDDTKQTVWTVEKNGVKKEDKVFSYDEAIEIAGNGLYNYGLLATLSLSILAMGVDMFGFSVVVAGSTCDFQLDLSTKSVLVSMPFLGPIFMSYPWGYISDTQGRRRSLLIAMWGAFFASTISAFSPNWIMMAVLKFVSTSFCSCAQSVTYALLGESCVPGLRASYMLVMTSILMLTPATYFSIGYLILKLNFSYDLGFVTFTAWRLLVLILVVPLGLSAIGLTLCYESPKFLANAGRENEALDALRNIYQKNGGTTEYPVKKLVLNEEGNVKRKDESLLRSLWEQTAPLFRPPLLLRTLQLYYLTAIFYSSNNSFVMWFPYISDAFFVGVTSSSSNGNQTQGLCNMIISSKNAANTGPVTCSSALQLQTTVSSIVHSISFTIINLAMSKLASRKKAMMIGFLIISCTTAIVSMLVKDNISSFLIFFCMLVTGLCIGLIFSYFIDIYPTSYRGMAACLAVMVARGSALLGINVVGAVIMDYCEINFYAWSAYIFSGIIVAWFLPPDKKYKQLTKDDLERT